MTASEPADRVPLDALLEHREWVRSLARSLVSDRHRADDVEQETWRLAIERPPRHGGSIRGWFRVVVRNVARKTWSRQERSAEVEAAAPAPREPPSPEDLVAETHLQHRLVQAVLELDEPYRSTLLYRYFESLPPRRIAERVGVPVETVRTRLKRGVARLREQMDDELGDDRRAWALLVPGYSGSGPGFRPAQGAAAGAAATSVLGGGMAMTLGTKAVVGGALALLLLALAVIVKTSVDPGGSADAQARVEGDAAGGALEPPARSPRGAASGRSDESPAGGVGASLDALDRERDLHGLVLDDHGNPVADARIAVLRRQPWGVTLRQRHVSRPRRHRESETSVSAADGTFSLRLTPGDGVGLLVDAPGFALWESLLRQAGERVIVRLTPAATLEVRVVTQDGTPSPVTPVTVHFAPREGERERRAGATDDQGHVLFERLPRGATGSVLVSTRFVAIAQQEFSLGDSGTETVELVLPAGRRVEGRVLDEATGFGIDGARVTIGFGPDAKTGAAGRFELQAIPDGLIEASAEGYAPGRVTVPPAGEVVVKLQRVARVVGRVVGQDGEPVAGADVALLDTLRNSVQSSRGGSVTGEDGRFDVDGLLPATDHLLRIELSGYALHYSRVATGGADRGPFDLGDVALRTPRTIRGSVVDLQGLPLARVLVRLTGPNGRGDHVIHLRRATDDLGRFAFPGLPAGTYEVFATVGTIQRKLRVRVPRDADPPDVVLGVVQEPAPSATGATTVAASVQDEDGNPLPDIKVRVDYIANGAAAALETDASGRVRVPAQFQPSLVTVHLTPAQRKRWLPLRQWLRPGQRDVSLVLRRGSPVAGRVVDSAGKPVHGAWVHVVGSGGTRTDDQGRFEFAVPRGPPVDVQAQPTSIRGELSRRVVVQRGVEPGTQDLVLVLGGEPASRTVVVDLVDARGEPVVGATVQTEFVGKDHQSPIMGMSDAEGRVRLDGLPRAPVTFSVTVADPERDRSHWELRPHRSRGDEDSVTIRATAPRVLTGRVVEPDGAPASGALVHAGVFGSQTWTRDDGRFVLLVREDAATPYPVYAMAIPGVSGEPRSGYDLVEDEEREYELVLRPVPGR